MTETRSDELGQLCQAAAEGTLDADAERRLNELIRDDQQALAFYVDYIEVHALLAWRHGAVEPLELPLAPTSKPSSKSTNLKPIVAVAASIAVVACGIVTWMVVSQASGTNDPNEPIAIVLSEEDVQWSSDVPQDGHQQLRRGRQRIESGTAHIELTNGVLLAAAGPCEFDLDASDHLHLYSGKMHIYSPLATRGFTVTTPRGVQIVDLGTRFGVWVDDEESVHVHLFDGRLEVNNRQQMNSGDAVVVGPTGEIREATIDDQAFPNLHRE